MTIVAGFALYFTGAFHESPLVLCGMISCSSHIVFNIHYETADKIQAVACGGIGAIHRLTQRIGLAQVIDERLHLLQIHQPYSESDHVLNIGWMQAEFNDWRDDRSWCSKS